MRPREPAPPPVRPVSASADSEPVPRRSGLLAIVHLPGAYLVIGSGALFRLLKYVYVNQNYPENGNRDQVQTPASRATGRQDAITPLAPR
jgi:hypothetical protein